MALIRTLQVVVALRSPFLFNAEGGGLFGYDAVALRDASGAPIIPAEQIRGVLRAALRVLAGTEGAAGPATGKGLRPARAGRAPEILSSIDVDAMFGRESASSETGGEQNAPDRGALTTTDCRAEPTGETGVVTRIALDAATDAVEAGSLQTIELVAPLGSVVRFTGQIRLQAGDLACADRWTKALRLALGLVPAIGALKTVGFGEVVAEETGITDAGQDQPLAIPQPEAARPARVGVRLSFDRPILVDTERLTDNLIRGRSVVPGAALKGALASRLRLLGVDLDKGAWADALARLHLSHAFPENDAKSLADLPVPLSVCSVRTAHGYRFADHLLVPRRSARLIGGSTPAFPVDWKSAAFAAFAAAGHMPAPAEIGDETRMHVSIDEDDLAAEDGKLFGTVRRTNLTRTGERRHWRGLVDVSGCPVREGQALLALLEGELEPLGRTNAVVSIEMTATEPSSGDRFESLRETAVRAPVPVSADAPDLFALTLLTPAMLVDAGVVANRPDPRVGFDDYAAYFRAKLGAELVNAFSSVRLAGGYLATRRRMFGKTYYPFVLTEAGSTFLLRSPAPDNLRDALTYGLPPANQTGGAPPDWRNCPFVRESGYGECTLNLVDHAALHRELDDV